MTNPFVPKDYAYRAFISYSRADTKIVDDLFSRLQKFRTPNALVKREGAYGRPQKRVKVYLDRRSAEAGDTVSKRLIKALESSAFLIVVCTPSSQASKWVNLEVDAFLDMADPSRILPVFLRESVDQPLEDVMPEGLRNLGDRCPIGADLLIDGGPESVSHKILGGMLGFAQDQIAQEQERADRRRRRLERTALSLIAALGVSAAIAGWGAYRQAIEAQRSLTFALDTLNQTTPMTNELVGNGQIRTDQAANIAKPIADRFMSAAQQGGLSADLKFGVGQVLTKAAEIYESVGNRDAQRDTAESALYLLDAFDGDVGSSAPMAYCDASFQLASAAQSIGEIETGFRALDECDRRSLGEISFLKNRQRNSEAIDLVQRAVSSRLRSAELHLRLNQFAEAEMQIQNARSDQRLGELYSLDLASGLNADIRLWLLQGNVSMTVERFVEAEEAFSKLPDLFEQFGGDPNLDFETQTALLKLNIGRGTAGVEEIDRSNRMLELLDTIIDADPTIRAAYPLQASVLLDRAIIESELTLDPANAISESTPYETLRRAEQSLSEILGFDSQNANWRFLMAKQYALAGEFYFRDWERSDQQPVFCARDCLDLAIESLGSALTELELIKQPSVSQNMFIAESQLARSRAMRYAGYPSAQRQFEAARQTLDNLRQTIETDRPIRMLSARIDDERADSFSQNGEYENALSLRLNVISIYQSALESQPTWNTVRRDLAWAHLRAVEDLDALKRDDEARLQFSYACTVFAELDSETSRLVSEVKEKMESLGRVMSYECSS